MVRKHFFASLAVASLVLVGCGTTSTNSTPTGGPAGAATDREQTKSFKFDYAARNPFARRAGGKKYSVILVPPKGVLDRSYARLSDESNGRHAVSALFRKFLDRFEDDLKKLLAAKGAVVEGPSDLKDLVYGDKERADFVLSVVVELDEASFGAQRSENNNFAKAITSVFLGPLLKAKSYHVWGSTSIKGKATLSITEPFTKTKLWMKEVPIDGGRGDFNVAGVPSEQTDSFLEAAPEVHNLVGSIMEKSYHSHFARLEALLSPHELAELKRQSAKIKRSSGFGG